MNINDDSFLNSLLKYHTQLVGQTFVDNVISKVKAKNKFRLKAMIMSMLLACIITVPLIKKISDESILLSDLTSLSPYIITFILLPLLGFCAWLSNENF